MFNGFMSPSTSPCPSPIKELASTIKRVSSPRREKYKTFVGSEDPIYSRGRMTMTGGFTDLRPIPYNFEKGDSLDSDNGTPSLSSSSRSESWDSNEAIMEPSITKPARRFVKIPKKGFMAVVGYLSPQLSKKLIQAERAPSHPVLPNVMKTYDRGISTSQLQSMSRPSTPSLTAMKAQAILDERRDVRTALQLLADKVSHQRLEKTSNSSSSCYKNEEDPWEPPKYEDLPLEGEAPTENVLLDEDVCKDLMRFNITSGDTFPINPEISVQPPDSCVQTPDDTPRQVFQDESVFEALDLESLPTITPQELASTAVLDVRNVHLVCDYIVLETGPPSESDFV